MATTKRRREPFYAAFVRTVNEVGTYSYGNGLILRVERIGTKRWIQRVTINGACRHLGLGSYPAVSLAARLRGAVCPALVRLWRKGRLPGCSAHPGVETQRLWSDLAIACTTSILPGFFSWTTLADHALPKHHPITQRTTAWYDPPAEDRRLLWTPSPWCVGTGGWRQKVFSRPQSAPISRNSPPPFTTEWRTPSLTLLDSRKGQLRGGGHARHDEAVVTNPPS